jgi:predicted GNAT family acetyltransferase
MIPITHRPIKEEDIQTICGFPQSEEELVFIFPKAVFPLTLSQLQDAIAQRSDSTVVVLNSEVVVFANFYKWGRGRCLIGNVIVSSAVRGHGVGLYLIEQMIDITSVKHQATKEIDSSFITPATKYLNKPHKKFLDAESNFSLGLVISVAYANVI